MCFLLTISLVFLPLLGQEAEAPDARGWLNRGVTAFKSGHYQDAVDAFQRALNLEPGNVNAALYLGTAYMSQWVPGSDSAPNQDLARNAERAFAQVLQNDPRNTVALQSVASLAYSQAQSSKDPIDKSRLLDEAKGFYEKLVAVNPNAKDAYYSLGVISWSKFYPALAAARKQLGMKPQDPGPLTDASARNRLRTEYLDTIHGGIDNLQKALAIDAQYDDAMAYMNLLMRERGDLWDSVDDTKRDVAAADAWVGKALATKKAKAEAGIAPSHNMQMAPPPPPPPPGGGTTPTRIRVGGNVQAANLISKVAPKYPAEAKAKRIQGTVRYQALIGRDGNIINLELITGHPLLIPSSMEAVKQWVYKPTLLNGQPVEVITQIDVNYTFTE